jgi:hypothetical protein
MRFRLALPTVVLLLASTACGRVLCENPLTSPADAKADGRLSGLYSAPQGINPDLLYLLPRKNSGTVDVIFMRRGKPRPGAETVGATRCDAFPSRVGDRTYLNARCPGWGDFKNVAIAPSDRYDIIRYEFREDGALAIRWMDTDPVVKAIENGQLAGTPNCRERSRTVGSDRECNPLVAATSAELAGFVASSDDTRLFSGEGWQFRPVPFPKLSAAAQESPRKNRGGHVE